MTISEDVRRFYLMTAGPALEALTTKLEAEGYQVYLHTSDHGASLTVRYGPLVEIRYSVEIQTVHDQLVAYPIYRVRDGEHSNTFDGTYRDDGALRLTPDEIVKHFMQQFPPHHQNSA